jgi:RNA polymerase sigma factor (sigma-70 family)
MTEIPDAESSKLNLEELYGRFGRELWARLYAFCCDRELALEATQEAFLRLRQLTPVGVRDFRAWLYVVAKNWITDGLRRKNFIEPKSDVLATIASSANDPAAIAIGKELCERVRSGLSSLREEDREVLVLRYSMDWPSDRIGQVLQIAASAVDMRLSRARKKLAEVLELEEVGHATG